MDRKSFFTLFGLSVSTADRMVSWRVFRLMEISCLRRHMGSKEFYIQVFLLAVSEVLHLCVSF